MKVHPVSKNVFQKLPKDCLIEVMKFLKVREIVQLCCVSKDFYDTTTDDHLWDYMYNQHRYRYFPDSKRLYSSLKIRNEFLLGSTVAFESFRSNKTNYYRNFTNGLRNYKEADNSKVEKDFDERMNKLFECGPLWKGLKIICYPCFAVGVVTYAVGTCRLWVLGFLCSVCKSND